MSAGVIVCLRDSRQFAPEQDHEDRRADEREPERRGDAESGGEQTADSRTHDQAAEHAYRIHAADPALKMLGDSPLPDGDRRGAPDKDMRAEHDEDR